MSALAFHARRSSLYHQHRAGYLDACHRWIMFLVILSGGTVVYFFAEGSPVKNLLPLVPALFGVFDIAFAPGLRSREHGLLAVRFAQLVAEQLRGEEGRELQARIEILYGEEPPSFKALDILAHNQICDSLRRPDDRYTTMRRHRLLKNVLRFTGTNFVELTENAKKKTAEKEEEAKAKAAKRVGR